MYIYIGICVHCYSKREFVEKNSENFNSAWVKISWALLTVIYQ